MMMRWFFLSFIALSAVGNLALGSAEVEEDGYSLIHGVRWVITGDLDELKDEGTHPTLSFKEYQENNCHEGRTGEIVQEGMSLSFNILDFLVEHTSGYSMLVHSDDRGLDASKQLIAVSHFCLTVRRGEENISLIEDAFFKWPLNPDFYGISTIRFILQREPYTGSWGCFAELVKGLGTPEESDFAQLRY